MLLTKYNIFIKNLKQFLTKRHQYQQSDKYIELSQKQPLPSISVHGTIAQWTDRHSFKYY